MVPLILLAAGRSTRFGSLKQVAPLGSEGESLLAFSVADALVAGFDTVVLVVREEIEAEIVDHLDTHLGSGLPIRTVHQRRPLGTAHAVLAALRAFESAEWSGACGVANGDDGYGLDALRTLRETAGALEADEPVRCALVPYRMVETLSPRGGVSRGLVEVDTFSDRVLSLEEFREVRRIDDPVYPMSGRGPAGAEHRLPRHALASMNLWALGPGATPPLQRAFERYLQESSTAEFGISTVLDDLRERHEIELTATDPATGWFGVTFAEDADAARSRLRAKRESGAYPVPLARLVDRYRR